MVKSIFIILSFFCATGLLAQTWSGTTPGNIYYNSGNVGIGINSPSGPLHVFGGNAYLWGLNLGWGTSNAVITTDDHTKGISLQIAGTEFARLHNNGNFGVGTNNPRFKIHTSAYNNTGAVAAYLWGQYYGTSVGVGNSSPAYYAFAVHGSMNADGTVNAGTRDLFYVRADGHIGIGNNTPSAKVHLTDGNNTIRLGDLNGYSTPVIELSDGGPVQIEGYNSDLRFLTAGTERLRITSDGHVGIGPTTPGYKLTVSDASQSFYVNPHLNGVDIGSTGSLTPHYQTDFTIYQGVPGSGNQRLRVDQSGNVSIGTTTASAGLTVAGGVHARKVRVTISAGADFVFSEKYKLPSLEELRRYIQQHRHLPDVPSANQMEKEGLELGEMNIKLLQKIEELTLYIIQQQKEIESLQQDKASITELRKEIEVLKKSLVR